MNESNNRRKGALIFGLSAVLCLAENLFLYRAGVFSGVQLVPSILGVVFGLYFLLLAKETLPAYYDENRISCYSDGFFRMNVPGLCFNNRNWPHILRVGRVWAVAVCVGYPALWGVFSLALPEFWSRFGLFVTLALVLGGLFIPMYAVGKKFE